MSALFEYVFNSLAWSGLGFVSGWLVASLRSDVATIREVVMHEDEQTQEDAVAARRRHTSRAAQRWVGVAITVLAVATVVQGVIATQRLNDVSHCQAAYNERFAAATKTRAQLAEDDRVALNNLLLSLYRQREATEQQRLATFEQWVEETERNQRERAKTPLPEYPVGGDC